MHQARPGSTDCSSPVIATTAPVDGRARSCRWKTSGGRVASEAFEVTRFFRLVAGERRSRAERNGLRVRSHLRPARFHTGVRRGVRDHAHRGAQHQRRGLPPRGRPGLRVVPSARTAQARYGHERLPPVTPQARRLTGSEAAPAAQPQGLTGDRARRARSEWRRDRGSLGVSGRWRPGAPFHAASTCTDTRRPSHCMNASSTT
jgi:hypothetical protein